MIRISDIVRMGSRGEGDPKDRDKEKERLEIKNTLLDDALKRTATATNIKELYIAGTSLIKDAFDKIKEIPDINSQQAQEYIQKTINFDLIEDFAGKFVDHIMVSSGELFNYFYRHQEDNYLYQHSLNVCLLSVRIGTWMDMNKSDLVDLALGGLLHDIALIRVESIISLPRKLKRREFLKVKRHPIEGADILEKTSKIANEIIIAIRNHHSRIGDKNFVRELTDEKIQKMAQVIGLADVYEAITHVRSYRKGKLPHEGIKELIESESNNFQTKIIKSLIDNIGIYPIGSWVRLTSGEIGLVVLVNKGYPLRPKVNVIFDVKGDKLDEMKSIDLLDEPHIHIDSSVDLDTNKHLIDKLR